MSRNKHRYHAIILAAGSGERFSTTNSTPKQYQSLSGTPVINYSIETFQNHSKIETITVVINENHKELYQNSVSKLKPSSKLRTYVLGGSTRKNSVHNALDSLTDIDDEDIILIHDAARPALNNGSLETLINHFETSDIKAATLAHKNVDTLIRSCEKNYGETINRDNIWCIQTPQAFTYKTIKNAHEHHKNDENFTDDAALVKSYGIDVLLVENRNENIKLTHPHDLSMLEKTLKDREEYVTITGQGFDVHAFDTNSETQKIRVGGIDIPHPRPLKAHSDGDVVLHAICDAIYGALSEGDIGHHFPPNDDTNKDRNSIDFIKHALSLVKKEDAEILHLDTTIIGERPKIDPYRDHMRQKIAHLLEVPVSRIAVKATTTEKLGFTGRQEGLACQAVINLHRKRKNL